MSQSKIYVGNLSYNTDEDSLHAFFGEFGEISELKLITDRETGRSKGFAFITFETDEAAQKAVEKDGEEVDGRRIKVSIARDDRGGARGGRGGAGSRNGGGQRRREDQF